MPSGTDMNDINATLDGMELDELRQVQKRLEGLIADYQDRKRRDAIAAAEQVAKEHGFKLNDLFGNGKPGKGGKGSPAEPSGQAKYANPDDPQQTWTGKGRRPFWVKAALDAGRTLEDLAM